MSKETTPGQDHVLKNDKRQYIGPIPAKLTLLSDLKGFKFGDKVRFLGKSVHHCLHITISQTGLTLAFFIK